MNEQKIIKTLNKVNHFPSSEWKAVALDNILDYADGNGVTKPGIKRNTVVKRFNFMYSFFMLKKNVFVVTLAVFTFLGLSFAGAVKASDGAVPGDAIYAIDRLGESVQRRIIFNPASKSSFEMDLLEERMEELDAVKLSEELTDEELSLLLDDVDTQLESVDSSLEFDDKVPAEKQEELLARYRKQIDAFMLQLKGMEDGFTGKFQQGEMNFEEVVNKFKVKAKQNGIEVELEYEFEQETEEEEINGNGNDEYGEKEQEEEKNEGEDKAAQEQNENGDDNGQSEDEKGSESAPGRVEDEEDENEVDD